MPISTSLDLGIQTLREAIQLTPATPALSILTMSRNILLLIHAENTGHLEEQRLARMVLDVAVAYSDGMKKLEGIGCKDPEIEVLSGKLQSSLESISRGLIDNPKLGFFARILTSSAAQKRLKGWEADLESVSLLLETQIRLSCVKMSRAISLKPNEDVERASLEERIHQANKETVNLVKSQLQKQPDKKFKRSASDHFPPMPSPIFFGRSHQVEQLVKSLVQAPAYHAILGPGGIGKTSVALNVLHDPRIVEVYGRHRYFLGCDTISDASGIITGLADMLGLNENSFLRSFKGFSDSIGSSILFLLDNFETPWEKRETRQKVEDLLNDLASISNLSIVVTLRGAERPCGTRWSRPFLPIIGPLDLSAACQTFMAIADVSKDDRDMIRLLEAVEFIPLAITLLAAEASYTSCGFLLERWQACKTSMVTRGWDSRLSSLDMSISLSLTSSRFISNPQAFSLLQILSLLPDGANLDELCYMAPGDIDVPKCVSTLLQVALTSIGLHDRLYVLAPIREYVQSKHPISHHLLQYVFSYHAELSQYAMTAQWTAEKVDMDEKLKSRIGNIHCVIWLSLGVEPLTNEAINATVNLAKFRRSSHSWSISHLLEQSVKIARASQKLAPLAACLLEIVIRMGHSPDTCMSALSCLEEAADILRHGSSPESSDLLVGTLTAAGWIMERLERPKEAAEVTELAVSLILPSTSSDISALAYMQRGESLQSTYNYSDCQKILELAGTCFNPCSYPILSLRLASFLSLMYSRRSLYGQSIRAADAALHLHQLEVSERAFLLTNRGASCLRMGRYEDARRCYLHHAIPFLASSGSAGFLSLAHRSLGLSYIACGNFTDAALSIHAAHQFSHMQRNTHPTLALATLELYQNHLDQSLNYLHSASKEISMCSALSAAHFHVLQIRCQVHIRQKAATVDTVSFCTLAAVFANRTQDRIQIALSILWLGDAFFFAQKDVFTSQSCYQYSLDLVRFLGNRRWIANALLRIGVADYLQGASSLAGLRINQASKFYDETDGNAGVNFCKEMLRLIDCAIQHENIPFFPPVTVAGF